MKIIIQVTGQNPEGTPQDWPKRKRYIEDSDQVPEGWVQVGSEDEFATYLSDRQADYDSGTAAVRYRRETPPLITAEAQRRICARLGYTPDQIANWTAKQINMTARGAEITRLEAKGQATEADLFELTQLEAFFGWVKQVRAYSNELEAAVDAGETVDLNEGWPE